ncbi:MAG: hypothetical protein E7631_02510 [Ruminococcaceae bacterium]|nr:hypothetical protein [Oscillospiraceae bacterium]
MRIRNTGKAGNLMRRTILTFFTAVLLVLLCTLPAFANATEPPCFTILVNGAPEDLQITVVTPEGVRQELHPVKRGWESYFSFYYYMDGNYLEREDVISFMLEVSTKGENYAFEIPDDIRQYNTIFHLDLSAGTLKEAVLAGRNALLVAMRVSITLVTEGMVLWLFGYRTKRTWIVFLAVNLVTQTLLNLSVTGVIPPDGYWWFALIFGEILIFLAEATLFTLLFREKGRPLAALVSLCANGISLAAGAWILSGLPL